MSINETIVAFAGNKTIDIIAFIDISSLPYETRRGYCNAILIGSALSKNYLRSFNSAGRAEFTQKEKYIDRAAEELADFLISKSYRSYAQSESNLGNDGLINARTYTSVLPHKTIALLSGIGWIGKNNLLVTRKYGSGFCMCTVLTDAPIIPENKEIVMPQCGACDTCKTACPEQALSGRSWEMGCDREKLVDINLCTRCLKCLVNCVWTQHYIQNS